MQQLLDNKSIGRVGDKLQENLKKGTKLSIISAYFTIYAFEALKKELEKIEGLRLLFSEPNFVNEKKNIKREFQMNSNHERGLSGDRYELKLKGELNQSEIAKECAAWIREKVEIKAFDAPFPLPYKMFITENRDTNSVIYGQADFTSQGLGYVPSEKPFLETYIQEEKNIGTNTKLMLQQFDMFWKDKEKVKDVKKEVLEQLEGVYRENTPEYIYFVTLYNIFKNYLEDLDEEKIVKSRTGFKDTIVWNKLYKFQKDGVLGAIDKIEKHNGCIIADSVGLGKTFEALAVIKYYELRNHKVLVLCPKKLRENWSIYTQNDRRNLLANDR
ncbi:MAG: SNF2-related protein, partial [Cetobacterium sp.]